ncbi:putative RNA methyltransferase At5g10620 isoform X2 [Rosa chinensis]|uniref:putative RNA methyltransferase At5g10620 isoform X2 n=1 Tax=Rosa chinensis TaxID=74649 RepID=UPI001AD9108B|nr:putative RNA methyltransferase At5g10620 isoform X2 [Rosa chinensis]
MVVVLSASATNFSALHSGSCFLESLASTLSFLIYFMSLAFTNLILFRISGKGCKYTGQARALPIRIISVGKKRSQGVQLVVDDYIQRLKLYCSVEDVHIKNNPKNASDWRAQVDHEDGAVMDLIRSDDWVVLLDERGKDIGSMQMAELIGDAGNTGASRLSFCVGGPYGHGKQLRERANISIKLSSMVLNHQIAILVLVEQLYRSWTILKGQNYHR